MEIINKPVFYGSIIMLILIMIAFGIIYVTYNLSQEDNKSIMAEPSDNRSIIVVPPYRAVCYSWTNDGGWNTYDEPSFTTSLILCDKLNNTYCKINYLDKRNITDYSLQYQGYKNGTLMYEDNYTCSEYLKVYQVMK